MNFGTYFLISLITLMSGIMLNDALFSVTYPCKKVQDCKLDGCPQSGTCCSEKCCCEKNWECCKRGGVPFCCPEGTECEKSTGECISRSQDETFLSEILKEVDSNNQNDNDPMKINSLLSSMIAQEESVNDKIVCPDPHWTCPGSQTCCRAPSGNWFCCVYPGGNCCQDGIHCCPYGTMCDPTSTHCHRAGGKSDSSLHFIQAVAANRRHGL